jgi:hypothetical protein
MEIGYHVKLQVIDNKTGKILEERQVKGESFLKWFASLCRLLFMRGDATESESVLDTSGTARTLQSATTTNPFPYYSPAAGNKIRCQVGISNQAVARDQYACVSPVATVTYNTYDFTDDGTKKTVTMSFAWLNNTGGSVDIAEACLILVVLDSANVLRTIAIARDVFSPAITVPANSTLAVGYVITIPW